MSPSYPSFESVSDLAISFTIPEKHIVCKILKDSEEDENLNIKATGLILYRQVRELARLMSRHRVQIVSSGRNELEVTLFLPPPPCPPPNTGTIWKKQYKQQLQTIKEVPEEHDTQGPSATEKLGKGEGVTHSERVWITLYEYMPNLTRKRDAMYASPSCGED